MDGSTHACDVLAASGQHVVVSLLSPLLFLIAVPCSYESTVVDGNVVRPVETKMQFRTQRKVPKVRSSYKPNDATP